MALGYQWLRNGAAISGATQATYVPADADVGRQLACVVTATNAAGDADSTAEAVTVSAASAGTPGPPGSQGPAGPAGAPGPAGPPRATPRIRVNCRLVGRRVIRCQVTTRPTASRTRATLRLAGSRIRATRTGRGAVTVDLRSSDAVQRRARVVVDVDTGTARARTVVRVGKPTEVAARRR